MALPPRRPPTALAQIVSGVLQPLSGRRQMAFAELRAAWPDIVGERYAGWTLPERLDWPRSAGNADGTGATLKIRADGPRAVLLQHELGQLAERVNAYLGHGAVAQIRIIQAPIPKRARGAPKSPTAPVDEARVSNAVHDVPDGGLKDALARLGRGVLSNPMIRLVSRGKEPYFATPMPVATRRFVSFPRTGHIP